MNLLQKLGITHDFNDYVLIIYDTNKGTAHLSFVRYVGTNEYIDIFSNNIILDKQIKFYKRLTDYVSSEKRYITDHKARTLIKPFYDQFSKEYFNFLRTQEENKSEKELQPLPFMC